jgi:hypothetical protein
MVLNSWIEIEEDFMKKNLLIVVLFINSTISLLCILPGYPLFDYVDRCDLIIQGELIRFDYKTSDEATENAHYVKNISYIKVNSILKNTSQFNCDADTVIVLMKEKNRHLWKGKTIALHDFIKYRVGQNGIWLLRAKGEFFTANNRKSFQNNSKEKYIKLLCDITPHTFQFLYNIRHNKFPKVKNSLKCSLIDVNDSIFYYPESNPILLASKESKSGILQDLIDYGFDVNFTNENNENALFLGVQRSRRGLDVVETLLKNGIETTLRNIKGDSIYDRIDKMDNKEELIELFNKYK